MGRAQTEPSKKTQTGAGKKAQAGAAAKTQASAGKKEQSGAGKKETTGAGKKAHGNGNGKGQSNGGKKERGGEAPSPVQAQKFLSGLDYPVDKQTLVDKAREEGADQEVVAALEKLPERQYDSPISVSREIGQMK